MAESTYSMEDSRPVFYIGEHETERSLAVTTELVQHAHDLGVSSDTFPFFFLRQNMRSLQSDACCVVSTRTRCISDRLGLRQVY